LDREDCHEIAERTLADGSIHKPIDPAELETLVQALDPKVDAVSLCLLHSSLNPQNELTIQRRLSQTFPRVFCSHRLSPGSGEYERAMTCFVAAYLSPKVESYIDSLARALAESELRIVHSAGGLLTPSESKELPHRLALSGPAAGLRGALAIGIECEQPNLVTLDMGGTSTDVALLANGELPYSWQTELEGYPLRAPTLEIHTIGAGGGSIAYLDSAQLLRVGPRSAGAQPGPVCYGRGGKEPTVTDALCYNGFLPTALGHEQSVLDSQRCGQALARLGQELGLGAAEVSDGILELASSHLASAVRKVTTGRGQDPCSFTLFPFGGAGPILACAVAESLEMETVLVPSCAGVLSAWGALSAPWEREWSRTIPPQIRSDQSRWPGLFDALEKQARQELDGSGDSHWTRLIARRYKGQGETLMSEADVAFHSLHQDRFGFSRSNTPVEAVEIRVRATRAPLQGVSQFGQTSSTDRVRDSREVRWKQNLLSVPLLHEPERFLSPEDGPLLIFQESSSVFVAPGWRAQTLANGHLLLTRIEAL